VLVKGASDAEQTSKPLCYRVLRHSCIAGRLRRIAAAGRRAGHDAARMGREQRFSVSRIVNQPFSVRGAVWELAAVVVIGELTIAAYGAKSCHDLSWAVYYVLYVSPVFYILEPWTVPLILIAPILGGFRSEWFGRHRTFTLTAFVLLATLMPLLTAVYTSSSPFTCSPL